MEIFEKFDSDTTIITPNRRLTANLLQNHQKYLLKNEKICWPTLDVLPFQSWLQRIWDQVSIHQMTISQLVLSTQQEQILWETIIEQSSTHESLMQLATTATLAKTAWATLKQWMVDIDHPLFQITEDCQTFQQWAIKFEILCKQNEWIDSNTLAHVISTHIKNQIIKLPKQIAVVGFTELSPIQKTIFENCEAIGTNIHFIDNLYPNRMVDKQSYYISLPDEETEIITIAKWAKQLSEENKDARIACIFPMLENKRERILQLFSEVFQNQDFNISVGKNLLNYPIIYAAITLLELCNLTMRFEEISFLLLTPFIGEAEKELHKRAIMESRLRQHNLSTFSLNEMHTLDIDKNCPHFYNRLSALKEQISKQPKKLLPSAWILQFIEILSIMGWPGERIINSQEYQILQRFLELLNEYQTYDMITEEVTYQEAIKHIRTLSSKIIFQPQTKNVSVQILGLLEASNLPFDFAWIAGLDDSVWPPSTKPNPFIPHKLQKSLHMPHATAERELIYSTKLTEQLKQSTDTVIFSHALKLGDADLRPSSLIINCKKIELHQIPQYDFKTILEKIFLSRSIEYMQDEKGPAINIDEKLRGGVNIIKRQAECPFKAFAEIRLHAKKLENITLGLRSQERGIITHKALELVWQQIKNHWTLVNLNTSELEKIIDTCVTTAIALVNNKKHLQKRYLSLEHERLKNLLWQWLKLESIRTPFKVISNEEEHNITIGNIPLTLRVDRVDQLDNGDHVIIDYKTGKYNSIKNWFGDRPDEPQLPIYALSDTHKIKGIAFAEIHPDKLTLLGISQNNLHIDKIKPINEINNLNITTWSEAIKSWEIIFEKLATEFLEGNASISPKNEIETCQYCDLKPLCRIHEYRQE